MKKKLIKKISALVPQLPVQSYDYLTSKIVNESKGAMYYEIKEGKHKGKFLEPMKREHPVNHLRRLKRAYQREGIAGIRRYFQKYGITPEINFA